jgi:hypothetical protein
MVATTLATATAALILGAAHASSPVQLAIDPSAIAGYAPHAWLHAAPPARASTDRAAGCMCLTDRPPLSVRLAAPRGSTCSSGP